MNALVVFPALTAACFVLARRFAGDPAWKGGALYSVITDCVVAVFFVASTVRSVLDEIGTFPNGPTGLLQRVAIIAGWGWIVLLVARPLRMARSHAE